MADGERLKELLRENAWDLTFRQIESMIGIPFKTVQRYMKRHKWRLVSKGTRPVLTPQHIKERLAWAEEHRDNDWKLHVDIDEKWFYVWAHCQAEITSRGAEAEKSDRVKALRWKDHDALRNCAA